MTEQEFIGWLIGALATIIGLLTAITVPIIRVNSNLVKLNSNFEYMRQGDETRDKRIEKHGNEIDVLNKKQLTTEKILDRHELRLENIEEKIKS